ncbi:AraC family transcriptional regulator [Luteimicrobium xylanilyticum]|uniref:RCS-specific HTH-type transcriptional activator RclR n=1 Tax=Luteimicrobium xylanilyticum TaxID=1133546 RepID=A0A5P9QAB4_9MICO|nr:AraC family transcriptional regulator [Luteimicrobium xylanilyticum]QFU98299.1 RCS-specific HTH-type transcriptional activator RclR [Luteimicrobium xylanilyticum]
MDPLTALLDGPRARGAFLLRASFDPPWSVRVADEAPATVVAVTHGTASFESDAGPRVTLGPGDVVVVPGPVPYTMAHVPGAPPDVVVHPGQVCRTPAGEPMTERMTLGLRAWGTAVPGEARMLVGTYPLPDATSRRILAGLPPLAVLGPAGAARRLVGVLDDELDRDEPGQEVVLDRVLDLLLVTALRDWFAMPDTDRPGWLRAAHDPDVGRALAVIHDEPAHAWTVEALARRAGMSRAAFARRFRELVGETPLGYLTGVRLALAADLLSSSDATLETVARRVGYATPFALSAAFKRVHGLSPQQYRDR